MTDSEMKGANTVNTVKPIFDMKKILMISLGTFIGSGVVSILGVAAGVTGYSVWLAYLVAILVGFAAALGVVALSSVMTFSGGVYSVACIFLGKQFGGAFALYSVLQCSSLAMMASAFGTYVNSVFPGADIRIFAVGILVVFWLVNIMGIDFMASVQKYSTYILLAAMLVFCIFSYRHLNMDVFHVKGSQFMTGGTAGFLGAMAMLVFSAQTYDTNLLPYGKYTKNSRRVLPRVMLYTMLILIVVYVGVSIAAVGAVNLGTVAGKPLTFPAHAVLPGYLFYAFIILGPVLCLTTTINGVLGGNVITLEKACEDGWFPRTLATRNRHKISWKILTLLIGLCILLIIFSVDIGFLTSNTVLIISCFQVPLLFSMWKLPDRFPEEFGRNTLKLSKRKFHGMMCAAILARAVIIVCAARNLDIVNVIIIVAVVAVCFLYSFLRHKFCEINVESNYFSD